MPDPRPDHQPDAEQLTPTTVSPPAPPTAAPPRLPTHRPTPHRPSAREPQVMLEDLTAELLWPRALRTPALALRPTRIMLGMAAVFIASLIGSLSSLWSEDRPSFNDAIAGPITVALRSAARAVLNFSGEDLGLAALALAELRRLPIERPVETVLLGIPVLIVFVLFGGAISRAVAIEFSAARFSDWPADIRVSASKLGWSVGAVVAPLAVAGVLIGLITLGGFTLGVPVVNILGAILFAIAIILAGVALILLVIHALALPMLVPALMCEGTDAYDAVQRSYAYIIARPLRLLVHAAILLVLGAVSIGLFSGFAAGADALATSAAARLTSDAGVEVLIGAEDLDATQPMAHGIITAWRALRDLTVSGFAFSYFFAAGTVLYLVARRICDGQGITEVWDPAADMV